MTYQAWMVWRAGPPARCAADPGHCRPLGRAGGNTNRMWRWSDAQRMAAQSAQQRAVALLAEEFWRCGASPTRNRHSLLDGEEELSDPLC